MIFVFGSNTAGIHGAGAAHVARRSHGAELGYGYGHIGNSFAIPTKDSKLNSLQLTDISTFVEGFLAYARHRQDLEFQVTRIGCGLAGFNDNEIAPFFTHAPDNCYFDTAWKSALNWANQDHIYNFWGTFE